jgi:hypothetical protein
MIPALSDTSSILIAEVQAILLAMDEAAQSAYDTFLVLSNTLSCLEAILNRKLSDLLMFLLLPFILRCKMQLTVLDKKW